MSAGRLVHGLCWAESDTGAYVKHEHIQGHLITGLYSNNVGYVLAQVESLVFRKQSARSKLLAY